MNRIKLWVLIAGFFTAINPAANLFNQHIDSGFAFDSLFIKGIAEVNSNPDVSRQCLKKMELYGQPGTPVMQARISYLKLKIFYTDAEQVKALETRMFTAPDSLGQKEALVWSATRYLERSMPDKAIPLLIKAIEYDRRSEWITWCTIHLCEAFREKQEYLKGAETLNEVLQFPYKHTA